MSHLFRSAAADGGGGGYSALASDVDSPTTIPRLASTSSASASNYPLHQLVFNNNHQLLATTLKDNKVACSIIVLEIISRTVFVRCVYLLSSCEVLRCEVFET